MEKIAEWCEYKKFDYFIEEQEMDHQVISFMINEINKGLPFHYIKTKKEIFLEDIRLFLGIEMKELAQIQKASYLL